MSLENLFRISPGMLVLIFLPAFAIAPRQELRLRRPMHWLAHPSPSQDFLGQMIPFPYPDEANLFHDGDTPTKPPTTQPLPVHQAFS